MASFEAHVEANIVDEATALELSQDSGWVEAVIFPGALDQASLASKVPNGDCTLIGYSKVRPVVDGDIYDFAVNVPVQDDLA